MALRARNTFSHTLRGNVHCHRRQSEELETRLVPVAEESGHD